MSRAPEPVTGVQRFRGRAAVVATSLTGLALTVALGPRPEVDTTIDTLRLPDDLDAYLAGAEAAIPGLRPGEAKRIVWTDPDAKTPTEVSLVYLHGFSADQHEVDPLPSLVAEGLAGNLFYARLTGHGRTPEAMADGSVRAWVNDAAEAIAIGKRLGESVVLMGTSTGATLALWAAAQDQWRDSVAAQVLLSPNLGLRDPAARILLWPWGGLVAGLIVGPERSFEPVNAAQAEHWTTSYPVESLLPMMALVDLARDLDLRGIGVPTYLAYSSHDAVVDPRPVEEAFATLGSARKVRLHVMDSGDPAHHVLAGDIMSPGTTARLAADITEFLRSVTPARTELAASR